MLRNPARFLSLLLMAGLFFLGGCTTTTVPKPVAVERDKALDYANFGVYWLKRGCYKDALLLFEESLNINQAMDDQVGLARDYNNLGTLAMEMGEFGKAKEFFDMAVQIQKDIQDAWGLSLTESNLVLLSFQKKNLDEAEKNVQEAYQAALLSKNPSQEASVLSLMGRLHLERGRITEAAQSTAKAINLLDKNAASPEVAAAFYNSGLISMAQKNSANARIYFEKALAVDQTYVNYPGIGSDLEMLARANSENGNWSEASSFAVRAFNVYYQRGDIKSAAAIYDLLEKVNQNGKLSFKLEPFAEKLKEMSSPEFDLPCRQ